MSTSKAQWFDPPEDRRLLFEAIIYGAPRTKKNHGRMIPAVSKAGRKFSRLLPSGSYEEWDKQVQLQLALVRKDVIDVRVNCMAIFYRDADRGDAVGYYQALADSLEKARVVKNDRLIVSWDGSRLRKDAARPRVLVRLTRE